MTGERTMPCMFPFGECWPGGECGLRDRPTATIHVTPDPVAAWDRDAYHVRVGEEEAARRRGAIMAEQWGYQLAEQRKRLGFTQAGLAEIMGVTPGRMPANPA